MCPALNIIAAKLKECNVADRRILWCFSLASALSLRAMELAYLNREYFRWNDDIGAYEIHFPRNLTKRDSYLRRCPTWATPWVQAFLMYTADNRSHPLTCTVAEYRKCLKRLLDGSVAASARHVGASYAHSEGSSHSAISEFLGHKGAGTVETYIHYDYIPGINFFQLLHDFEELYGKSFLPAPAT